LPAKLTAASGMVLPPGMPGRAGCPALGTGARWTPWHATRPPGASHGTNELGRTGSGCRACSARVPGWFGGRGLAAGGRACHHRPAGGFHPWRGGRSRLPPRGPPAGPSQVQPDRMRPSGRGRSIPSTNLHGLRPKVETPARTGLLARERRLRDHAAGWRRRYALWCRSREVQACPGNASLRPQATAARGRAGMVAP
jgi:hypothetical protein